MKKLFLGTVALIALSAAAPALAADLGARTYTKAPAYVATVYDWTGFYLGAQVGYGWSRNSYNDLGALTTASYNGDGVFGGLRAGYNWQMNNLVFGLQGDVNITGIDGNDGAAGGVLDTTKMPWNASIVGRVGWAFNNAMLYGLGGVAFANVKHERTGAAVFESHSQTYVGWTLGAGLEYAFTPNWTTNVEYRYTDYGTERFNYAAFTSPVDVTVKTHTVSVGLTYKFGGPVVAKY